MSDRHGVQHPNDNMSDVRRYDAAQIAAYPRTYECDWCGETGEHLLVEVTALVPDEHGPFTLERGAFVAVDSVEKRARAISHERLVRALVDPAEKARIATELGLE